MFSSFLKNAIEPLPVIPAVDRYCAPAASALDSWARLNARYLPIAACWPAISTPIAVQCEKLIGGRYSLFDYVVRAAVKACASEPEWLAGDAAAELLMVLDKGEKYVFIENASGKTIYNIAMERLAAPAAGPFPAGSVAPNILLCDSGVNVAAQRAVLPEMPHSIISIGGTTPKTGIEAGRPVSKLILPASRGFLTPVSKRTAAFPEERRPLRKRDKAVS